MTNHDHDDPSSTGAHEHDHVHGAGHDHPHPAQPDHDAGPMGAYEVMEEAVRLLLIEKGILSAVEIAAQIDLVDSRSPALGAMVVARAWTDPPFKLRLLADCRRDCRGSRRGR